MLGVGECKCLGMKDKCWVKLEKNSGHDGGVPGSESVGNVAPILQ